MENNKYAKELEVGVKVVQMACSLCKTVQKGVVSGSFNQVKSKNDDSPVTVAGNFFIIHTSNGYMLRLHIPFKYCLFAHF